jgi:hypothetical protein
VAVAVVAAAAAAVAAAVVAAAAAAVVAAAVAAAAVVAAAAAGKARKIAFPFRLRPLVPAAGSWGAGAARHGKYARR